MRLAAKAAPGKFTPTNGSGLGGSAVAPRQSSSTPAATQTPKSLAKTMGRSPICTNDWFNLASSIQETRSAKHIETTVSHSAISGDDHEYASQTSDRSTAGS